KLRASPTRIGSGSPPSAPPAAPEFEMIERHHRERMPNLSSRHQIRQLPQRHEPRQDILAAVQLNRVTQPAVLHEHKVARVIHNRGIGKDVSENSRVFPFI